MLLLPFFLFCSYLLTKSGNYAIMLIVYAFGIIFLEDIMDDGDGETCHSMKIIGDCQA